MERFWKLKGESGALVCKSKIKLELVCFSELSQFDEMERVFCDIFVCDNIFDKI